MLLSILVACPGDGGDSDTAKTDLPPDSLAAIQAETFTVSCAFAGCHGGADPAEDLDLTAGRAHASLVNVESPEKEGAIRVVPGDHAASYLYLKLTADPSIEGDPMPTSSGLDPARLANIVAWIDGGAADE